MPPYFHIFSSFQALSASMTVPDWSQEPPGERAGRGPALEKSGGAGGVPIGLGGHPISAFEV